MSVTPIKAKLMQGNQACAEGALYAGCRFFAGYPITPSSEIAEILSERLPQVGGHFLQMEDEIASMAATIGGSLAGSKAMTATSGPGFSLKQEAFGYGVVAEVPCVVVNVQRLGPSTGVATAPAQGDVMQARWGTHGDHPVIALCPNSVQECFELTIKAFNLAERFRTPVIMLMDEVIGHMRERIVLPEVGELKVTNRKKPSVDADEYFPFEPVDETLVPPMANFGEGYRFNVTGLIHDKTGFPTTNPGIVGSQIQRLHEKINRGIDEITIYEEVMTDDADVVLITFGCMSRSASRAVKEARAKGQKVGMLRIITMWPFPEEAVKKVAQNAKAIIVPEMNLGQVTDVVKATIEGKVPVHGLFRVDGEIITPGQILDKIGEVL